MGCIVLSIDHKSFLYNEKDVRLQLGGSTAHGFHGLQISRLVFIMHGNTLHLSIPLVFLPTGLKKASDYRPSG